MSVAKTLGLVASVAQFMVYLAPLGLCQKIWNRGTAQDVPSLPILMGFVNGFVWWFYARSRKDNILLGTSSVAVVLYSAYTLFYRQFHPNTLEINTKIISAIAFLVTVWIFVRRSSNATVLYGRLASFLSIANTASPLANLLTIIESQSSASLPFPICLTQFIKCVMWCLYAVLMGDFYLLLPNIVGTMLATAQLALFVIYPS